MDAALDNWRTAAIDARTRAMLGFLERLTLDPDSLTSADLVPLRAAGLSDHAIEDAIHVNALFSVYTRLADTFEFAIPEPEGFEQSATTLLRRGYV